MSAQPRVALFGEKTVYKVNNLEVKRIVIMIYNAMVYDISRGEVNLNKISERICALLDETPFELIMTKLPAGTSDSGGYLKEEVYANIITYIKRSVTGGRIFNIITKHVFDGSGSVFSDPIPLYLLYAATNTQRYRPSSYQPHVIPPYEYLYMQDNNPQFKEVHVKNKLIHAVRKDISDAKKSMPEITIIIPSLYSFLKYILILLGLIFFTMFIWVCFYKHNA
ncbi:hypothetical protein NEPAR08_1244 [Nematocida parisii]|nr:hypothetical protein NEPAR08_1244 [Nematocida parisii]KAI5128480.1 hypothetical protein NEPAR03_1334 [Nematocida parisii]